MKKFYRHLQKKSILLLVAATALPIWGADFYVDLENGDPRNDGLSWESAVLYVNDALMLASFTPDGDTIHVTAGWYDAGMWAPHWIRSEITLLGGSDTVAVALPATPFGLAHHEYTPAQAILEAGGILALATDCNPGTAWCESVPFVIALACRYLRLTPAQALVAATLNAAHAVGLGDQAGSLTVERIADVLVLDLPDYRHLGYRFGTNPVGTVVKSGQIVSR